MPLTISDEWLRFAGLSERDAHVEIACRLYSADVISKQAASRLAGLTRVELEAELTKRGLPWIRITDPKYVEQELRALKKFEVMDRAGKKTKEVVR